MSGQAARIRRLDKLEERLKPTSTWPCFVLIEDPEDQARKIAELERLHGPRPEGHTLFIMTGIKRRKDWEDGT